MSPFLTTSDASVLTPPPGGAPAPSTDANSTACFPAWWPLVFAANVLVWTVASWLYRANLDPAGDMLENYAWGMEWQAGYHKHPPLFAWITAAWFSVFPRGDFSYFALAATNAAVGLLGIVALGRRYLTPTLAIVAGLAMAVTPPYGSLAIKFNANTVLLSLWPWTAYFFVRYMQSGERRAALGLGILAALSMLAKYYSAVLLLTLLLAACVRPAWRRRLADARIGWAIAVAVALLAPHVLWMINNGMPTLQYVDHRMQEIAQPMRAVFTALLSYTGVQFVYLIPALVFLALLVNGARARAALKMLRGLATPGAAADLWWLAAGHLFVTIAVSLLSGAIISSQWGRMAWFSVAPLWLIALQAAGFAIAPRRALTLLIAYWCLILALSPALGYRDAVEGTRTARMPRAELAQAAQAMWRSRYDTPLAIVTGSEKEARAVAFYGPGRTRVWDLHQPDHTPWLTAADLAREGALVVCPAADLRCRRAAAALTAAPGALVSVHKRVWSIDQPAQSYWLYFVSPGAQDALAQPSTQPAPAALPGVGPRAAAQQR